MPDARNQRPDESVWQPLPACSEAVVLEDGLDTLFWWANYHLNCCLGASISKHCTRQPGALRLCCLHHSNNSRRELAAAAYMSRTSNHEVFKEPDPLHTVTLRPATVLLPCASVRRLPPVAHRGCMIIFTL